MPLTKYIVTSECWIDGKSVRKGQQIELNTDDPREMEKIAYLNRVGRIGEATKKNIEAINRELAAEAQLAETNRSFQPARATA